MDPETPIIEQEPANGSPPPGRQWEVDKQGRAYVRAEGRRGIVYRSGEETVEEALERDSRPRGERPRKPKAPKKPPPSRKVDLRELEELLADALRSPAVMAAALGDEWLAEHFTLNGPVLARNLVKASEHNPWLRRKLEAAAEGGNMMTSLAAILGVGAAIGMYAVPPIVYCLNLPVPDQMRMMFGIPNRRVNEPPPPPAAFPQAA